MEFADFCIKKPFDSSDADYIRREIAEQIKFVNLTVCLFGPTTCKNNWVNWELNKALELGKPLMGVSLYSARRMDKWTGGQINHYPTPLEKWPRIGWNIQQIVETMERLARTR